MVFLRARARIKTDKPERLVNSMSRQAVENMEIREHFVLAEVKNYDSFVKEINDLVKQGIILLQEMKAFTPTLEEIFTEVMRKESYEKE